MKSEGHPDNDGPTPLLIVMFLWGSVILWMMYLLAVILL